MTATTATTAAQLNEQLIRRLHYRRHDGEDINDVIRRLLDEALEEVPIDTLIHDILDYYDHVASIAVHLHHQEDPTSMSITIYTGDVDDFEEGVPPYQSARYRATIENNDGDEFTLPFFLVATCNGPQGEMLETTPVYMADNILGAEPISVQEGLERLREKIGKPYDEVRELIQQRYEQE